MNKLPFYKAQALGNDFVIIKSENLKTGCSLPQFTKVIADRRKGIGADQVIYYRQSDEHFHIDFYNADGSYAKACGNGSRAFAAFLFSKGEGTCFITPTKTIDATVKHIKDSFYDVELPLTKPTLKAFSYDYEGILSSRYINVGNEHVTVFMKDCSEDDFLAISGDIQNSDYFPDSVNVGIAIIRSPHHISLWVNERGVGPTPACGTGAEACIAAARDLSLIKHQDKVIVSQVGGDLTFTPNPLNQGTIVSGPAQLTFEGLFYY